jgi:hypothetical protein
VDAIEAARAAQADRQLGAAKSRDGQVEAIRALVVAKRSARASRIQTMNQIRHLGFTAPEDIRQSLQGVSRHLLPQRAAAMRPRAGQEPVVFATKTALRALGRRVLALQAETKQIDLLLGQLIKEHWEDLLAVYGVGIDSRRCPAGRRGRQPRPVALRDRLGSSLRRSPHRSVIRQGDPAEAQPRQ